MQSQSSPSVSSLDTEMETPPETAYGGGRGNTPPFMMPPQRANVGSRNITPEAGGVTSAPVLPPSTLGAPPGLGSPGLIGMPQGLGNPALGAPGLGAIGLGPQAALGGPNVVAGRVASGGSTTVEGPRIVIGLDYGTTFTGVAWIGTSGRDRPDLEKIRIINTWSNWTEPKVPSQISYDTPEPQWGKNIQENLRIMRWTKLELEGSRTRVKELEHLYETLHSIVLLDMSPQAVLGKGIPLDIGKDAEEIVADYLERIAEKTLEEIIKSGQFHGNSLARTPIDIIITHPADWSASALNKTFRAAMSAFSLENFPQRRNVSFVTEPEACAHYTLRAAQKQTRGRLKRGDCFVVVDAGGGTVDLASYQAVEVGSDDGGTLRLRQIGEPTGNRYGATLIDRNFFQLLLDRMGEEDYNLLTNQRPGDFGSGGHFVMQENTIALLNEFEHVKQNFDGTPSQLAIPIPLPDKVAHLDKPEVGIQNGRIGLTTNDLLDMFHESVEGTLMLIQAQVTQVTLEKLKVKSIFMSGGLGSNPYLNKRVQEFADLRKITVERGEIRRTSGRTATNGDEPPRYEAMPTSDAGSSGAVIDGWSAVARGAVLKGLGLFSEKPAVVASCPRHYGLRVRRKFTRYDHKLSEREVDPEGVEWALDQLRWFVRKGDLILPNASIEERYDCHMSMKHSEFQAASRTNKASGGGVFRDILFVASSADPAPTRYHQRSNSTEEVVALRCDVSKIPESHRRKLEHKKAGKFYKFWMSVFITVNSSQVELRVMSGNVVLVDQAVKL